MPPTLSTIFSETRQDDATLRVHRVGRLATAGRVVARDPLTMEAEPFAVRFPAGTFDVELLLATRKKDTRVALARVVFGGTAPVRWSLALRDGEDERALAPGQRFGYGVDAGMGSFIDEGCEGLIADDVLDTLRENEAMTWTWALYGPHEGGHHVVMFSSGYGDGVYASYVGYDAAGSAVQLVTDFGVVDVELPEIAADPAFRATHARALWERIQPLVADMAGGKTYGQAYELAAELFASPDDAAPFVGEIWDGLDAWSDQPVQRDFHRVLLERILRSPAALVASLPRMDLGSADTARYLGRVQELPGEAREALWARYDAMHVDVRARFLEMVGRTQLAEEDTRYREAVTAALDDPALVETALGLLRSRARIAPDHARSMQARVAELAETGATREQRRPALDILAELDAFPDALLAASDHERRFEAASALGRKKVNAERTDPILRELARDAALPLDDRLSAATTIWDVGAKIDALVELGLAGHRAAAIQMRYVGGAEAVAGLERLIRETDDAAIREDAERWLATTKKLLDRG